MSSVAVLGLATSATFASTADAAVQPAPAAQPAKTTTPAPKKATTPAPAQPAAQAPKAGLAK